MKEPLHIKTYFSTTVEAAVALARKELGPDAMLMNSRQTGIDHRHLGQYEVVFATAPLLAPERAREAAGEPASDAGAPEQILTRGGVEPRHIAELLKSPGGTKGLFSRMESAIGADATLGRTVALVGPPGSGKTTTLVKLAVRYGTTMRVPVRIFSASDFRVGAGAQLRSFATMLGVSLQSCESIPMLEHALNFPAGPNALTLIDTAGYGRHDIDAAAELARCLSSREIDVHLVLRAEAKTAEILRAAERYRIFRPAKLIFTGLDEAESFGNLFSAAKQTRKPVSFLCSGQRVPEDLEPATARRIVDLAWESGKGKARAAA